MTSLPFRLQGVRDSPHRSHPAAKALPRCLRQSLLCLQVSPPWNPPTPFPLTAQL